MHSRPDKSDCLGIPFDDATEAWFWCMAASIARRDGGRPGAGLGGTPRPCESQDIVICIDRLRKRGRLNDRHLQVMLDFGSAFTTPHEAGAGRHLRYLWREAIERLTPELQAKGIVVTDQPQQRDCAR